MVKMISVVFILGYSGLSWGRSTDELLDVFQSMSLRTWSFTAGGALSPFPGLYFGAHAGAQISLPEGHENVLNANYILGPSVQVGFPNVLEVVLPPLVMAPSWTIRGGVKFVDDQKVETDQTITWRWRGAFLWGAAGGEILPAPKIVDFAGGTLPGESAKLGWAFMVKDVTQPLYRW